ncbi:MAG TPA: peptidylprolyl isomerase [Gemmatimonadaceae bacterium]|nr:peptidylprolyl isomerase [Gemmatimonadaceae bacterium]
MRPLLVLTAALLIATAAVPKPATYPVARIRTPQGEILVLLSPKTPKHDSSFVALAASHYWDTLTFNRVVHGFVIQGGCPDTKEGFAGSPYLLKPEFDDSLRHVYGAFGAGRDDNPQMLSAGCQFYIVTNPKGEARLDGKYTVYGMVIHGMDVVETIDRLPVDSTHRPLTPVTLKIDVIRLTAGELKQYGVTAAP